MTPTTQEFGTELDRIVAAWKQRHIERFWRRVDEHNPQRGPGGCWIWVGTIASTGYGAFSIRDRFIYAHRFSYELAKGPIPDGLQIDHLCRQRLCVNPDHLEAVTPRENNLRAPGMGGLNAAKTHCPKGHPYDLTNTWFLKSGRQCRECSAARQADPEFRRRRNARRRDQRASR